MDVQHRVLLIGGDGDEQAIFTLSGENDVSRLRCSYRGEVIESIASDYFEALCEVRSHLLTKGRMPFCYGASLNVRPSGMSRSMGRGLKAYRLIMARSPGSADLVEIFAEGPDVVPVSVAAQTEFFEAWKASLRA